MDIFVLAKRIGNLFNEVEDISLQLAEAIDRRDEVSMRMIVAMRYEPIQKLSVADRAIREHLDSIDNSEDAKRIRAIMNGDESAAQGELEQSLAQQASSNIRLQKRIIEQDKMLSKKIAGDKSIYP